MAEDSRENAPPGRLYFQVLPESWLLKQLLLDGFVRNCTFHIVPQDVVHICLRYYDEVQHWNVDVNELEPYYNLPRCDKDNNKKNQLYTEIFYENDVKMQCSLQPNKTNEDTVFYLYVFLPNGVEKITIYSEVFCAENNAHFRYVVPYIAVSSDDWHYYEYVMYLKCEDFQSINLSYYFEILSIKYSDGTLSYFKPIKMKKELNFKWDFDEIMIKKFRSAGTKQMFLSDTFDEYNNNWGLWIIPMDYEKLSNTKKIQIALTLYKKPEKISTISVRYILKTNYKNIQREGTISFLENVTFEYLEPLFESDVLSKVNAFYITLSMEVVTVNGLTIFPNVFDAN